MNIHCYSDFSFFGLSLFWSGWQQRLQSTCSRSLKSLDCRRLQRGHCKCLPLPNINAPPDISNLCPCTSAFATFDLPDSTILPNVAREMPIFFAASSWEWHSKSASRKASNSSIVKMIISFWIRHRSSLAGWKECAGGEKASLRNRLGRAKGNPLLSISSLWAYAHNNIRHIYTKIKLGLVLKE